MAGLQDTLKLGSLELKNRVLMAPLTRCRAGAGDVAQQTTTSVLASKLGGFGGLGGFGHKKKQADAAQPQTTDASATKAGDPASSVLIESSTTLSDFSSAPVDGSHFQVPAGYQQVTPPGPSTS